MSYEKIKEWVEETTHSFQVEYGKTYMRVREDMFKELFDLATEYRHEASVNEGMVQHLTEENRRLRDTLDRLEDALPCSIEHALGDDE